MYVGVHVEKLRELAGPRATERGLDVNVVLDQDTRAIRIEFGRDGHVTCWTELELDDLDDPRKAQDVDAAALAQIDTTLRMRHGPRPS